MKNIYNPEIAHAVERAVIEEFGFDMQEIVGLADTRAKKITVAVLHSWFDFPLRPTGEVYRITWPFIPTVTGEIHSEMLVDADFRKAVYRVINQVKSFLESKTAAA